MRIDILEYLQKEILARCKKPANIFGMGCYYHTEAVVKNGALLAEKYGADKEIVMVAAWLHDIASITDGSLYEEHHIYGAEMAYSKRGMGMEEGRQFVKDKLERSFDKLSDKSKKHYRNKYQQVMNVLNP